MNEEDKLPFFLNTRRLQRADSYFDIGRTQKKLRRLLGGNCGKRISADSESISCNDLEEHASVGFYGVKRYLHLEPDPGDDDLLDNNFIEIDEDAQFENTSAFSLFWMTFKRIALSISDQFSSPELAHVAPPNDLECNKPEVKDAVLCKVLVDPSFRDPRIKQSKIVYGDVNYLIQKFRMDLNCGSLDIALFSVQFPSSQVGKIDSTDLQAYVVSPECGSYVWIENGKASAIFMTKSSTEFFGNVMEWFRKILSDMALADSVMIGHPYYWHATVRRRLTKVMKYLKRLYRTLTLREKERQLSPTSQRISSDAIDVICPSEISKIVINEQPSANLHHTNCTYEQLNVMLEQLVKKWFEYQRNLKQSFGDSIHDISHAWSNSSPQSLNRPFTDEGGNFLESVTFLDFFPDKRDSDSNADDFDKTNIVSNNRARHDNNNNIAPMNEALSKYNNKVPCVDTGQRNTSANFKMMEYSRHNQEEKLGGDQEMCKVLHSSETLISDTSIDIDDSDLSLASFPHNEAIQN